MADKKLKDLDDIEKYLKEDTADELQGQPGRRLSEMKRRQEKEAMLREEGKILLIPLLVIVLMIVIVIADGIKADRAEQTAVSESTSIQDSNETETEMSETETTEDPTLVKEYYDNTLEDFFAKYFQARLEQDTDTLYAMTGVTTQTEAQTAALKSQLKTQAGYIEGYQDIKLYAVNALEDYSKLVFVTYNVKFRRVDTLAPGIMYCYIRVNEQNSYEIVENMQPDQVKFVNTYIQEHDEVRELIDTTNSRLLQALSTDQRLAVVYDAFMTGRIYTEDQAVIDSEVSLITSAADEENSTETESAAETETVPETEMVSESETAAE